MIYITLKKGGKNVLKEGTYKVLNDFSIYDIVESLQETFEKHSGLIVVSSEDYYGKRSDHESIENDRESRLSFTKNQVVNIVQSFSLNDKKPYYVIDKKLSCCDLHSTQIWIPKSLFNIFEDAFRMNFQNITT